MEIIMEWIVRFMVWLSRWAQPLSRCGIIRYDEWHPGKKLKMLLVGYNGARNTGADARVVALVEQLIEEFGNDAIEITVMTLNPENVKGYFPASVKLYPFPTFFCWSLFRAASAHHVALLCEGSTLTHTFADALSMFFCQAAGIMKQQGKPCVAYGSDVTPLQRRLRRLTQQMCSEVQFIARSKPSLNALNNMGLRCTLGTDTAWTFGVPTQNDKGRELLIQQGWDGKQRLMGVAVINPYCWPVRPSMWKWFKAFVTGQRKLQYDKMYFFSDSANRRRKYQRYLTQLATAVKAYKAENDAFVVIIGMEKLDARACQDFRQLMGDDCAMVTSLDTPVFQMTSLLHCLDVLVTSRYHAAVLSMLKGMPIVAVSMDNRLDGLFRDIPVIEPHLHHVGDTDLANGVIRSLKEAEANNSAIVDATSRYVDDCRTTLKEMATTLAKQVHTITPSDEITLKHGVIDN